MKARSHDATEVSTPTLRDLGVTKSDSSRWQWDGATREEAIHWAINNQWTKRNLTPEQERYLLGRKYTAEKNINGGTGANQHTVKEQVGGNLQAAPAKRPHNPTAKRIGDQAGVSDYTVKESERYANALDALDERGVINKADVLSGKVKIPATRVIQAAKTGVGNY